MALITVNITVGDLVRLNAGELMRPGRLLGYFVAISLAIATLITIKHGLPQTSRNWFALVAGMLGGGIGGILVTLLLSTLAILFMSSKLPGVLGHHEYEFVENGLIEKTSANETLIKWGGARALHKNEVRLLIEILPAQAHIVPRRAFASEAEFSAFAEQAQRLVMPRA